MLIIRCSRYKIQGFYNLHNFQHLLLYSTTSPNQSYSNYLINHLGFSHHQARSTSAKLLSKNVNYSRFSINANSVVHFLKQHGFDDARILKVVSSYPRILYANVDKTLKPKFKLIQDEGFSGSNLVSVISSSPSYITSHIHHIIHDLKAILGSTDDIIKFFRRRHFVMGPSALENLISNIALLNNQYGLDIGVIRNGILHYPGPYLRDTDNFGNILVRVEQEVGIPRNSGMFLYGLVLLSKCSKKVIESKCQVLKSFGWTEYDVSEVMRRSPSSFLKSKENIRKKLCFLMTELGYKPEFIATHSALLNYSLEKRMVPRHRVLLVLKEKGLLLDYNFYTATSKTEIQFLKIYIEPFKEDAPGLLQLYQSNEGCYSNINAISKQCQALS